MQASSKNKNVTFLPVDRAIVHRRFRAHQIEIQDTKKTQPAHESRKIANESLPGIFANGNFSSTHPTGTINQKETHSEKQNQKLKPSNFAELFAAVCAFGDIGEIYFASKLMSRPISY
ncbi:MAG: hypothetical protein WCF71_08400 [Verrucomicrobiia bacterium]